MAKTKYLKILLPFFFFLIGCKSLIHIKKEENKENAPYFKNEKYYILFELYFQDSVIVKYNGRQVFRDFVQTDTHLGISRKICSIDSISPKGVIEMTVNNKYYKFKPLMNYRFYFLSKYKKYINVEYSNIERDHR